MKGLPTTAQVLLLATICCGSSNRPTAKTAVTVVDYQVPGTVREALRNLDPALELRFVDAPNPPVVATSSSELVERISAARAHYVNAEGAACLKVLDASAQADELLAEGRRQAAARVLFWRIACSALAERPHHAEELARHFGSLGFEPPADTDSVTPDVEHLLAGAIRAVTAKSPSELSIESQPAGAVVMLDGQPHVCRTPCRLRVAPGQHVIRAQADGFLPAHRTVAVSESKQSVELELRPAGPKEAARQWAQGYARPPAIDSDESLRLLATAVRARRLVFLRQSSAGLLRGGYGDGGVLKGRAERAVGEDGPARPARSLVRELLIEGGVLPEPPPVWKRTGFWIAVGVAAVIGAGVTAYLLYDPPIVTDVGFGGGQP